MEDRTIAQAMHDLLSMEPPEAEVFEWLRDNRDRIAQVAALCEKSPFHEKCGLRRQERITVIDTVTEATNAQKAVLVWVDMLASVCRVPEFVPPECVAIANLPIVMKYLDAAIAESKPLQEPSNGEGHTH